MKKKVKVKKILFLCLGIVIGFLVHNFIAKLSLVTENYGMVFSMNWFNPLFLNILFILIISWFIFNYKFWSLDLILIGGMVNMADRLIFGFVRDYWNFGGLLINNLNDWLIGLGVSLFILENLWKKQK